MKELIRVLGRATGSDGNGCADGGGVFAAKHGFNARFRFDANTRISTIGSVIFVFTVNGSSEK